MWGAGGYTSLFWRWDVVSVELDIWINNRNTHSALTYLERQKSYGSNKFPLVEGEAEEEAETNLIKAIYSLFYILMEQKYENNWQI
jgi:hypothetical protein